MAKTVSDRPNPLRITDPDTNETYVLDFDRDAVKFAEQRGFSIQSVVERPETGIADLFFYAFRKNHRNMARANTDALLDKMEGLLAAEAGRLQELYAASISSLNTEGVRKNARVKVEM